MSWLILAVAIGLAALTIAIVLGRIPVGGGMGRPSRNLAHLPLPEGRLTESDLAALRFDVEPRGYRMSEVDAVIDRLRRELAERDGAVPVETQTVPAGPDEAEARPEVAPHDPAGSVRLGKGPDETSDSPTKDDPAAE